ncbi:MAG TPA: CxxxxCH/CxxCH domain-containing protein, partial [Anaeromyxobacter sp.]
MRRATLRWLVLCAVIPLVAGCDKIRPSLGGVVLTQAARCAECHGDPARESSAATDPLIAAAPPAVPYADRDRAGEIVGAHDRHLRSGPISPAFPCQTCHVLPAGYSHQPQAQGKVTFSGRASVSEWPGTAVFQAPTAPVWNGATAGGARTCSGVYCHGNFPNGAGAVEVAWTGGTVSCGSCHGIPPPPPHPAVAADPSGCATCHPDPATSGLHVDGKLEFVGAGHDASWMDVTSPGFHAAEAITGLDACARCHGATLAGGVVVPGCGACHDQNLPAGVTTWSKNCTMCHGGVEDATGAPPKATWGHGGDPVRTGAHHAHVAAVDGLAPPIACTTCHPSHQDALEPGHVAGTTAVVTFDTLATPPGGPAPVWDRQTATCSATYCHGATLAGGSNTAPVWTTLDGSQDACGTCHGIPPPAPHPTVASDRTVCIACHPATVDAAGAIIPPSSGGKHLDGIIESQGHPADWMDTTSTGFHAYGADRGLALCESCHGQDLSGGPANVACGTCHDQNLPVGVASWKTNCTMCHGGTNDQTGAPPRTTWGQSSDPIRTGAH